VTIAIQAPKASRIRGAAATHPGLDPAGLATLLALSTAEVRTALNRSPKRRVKSRAS